ncbi:alanine racemase [Ammonicoccus fulvus]|uniref:Alanine racemase n=1 Tax=Ammonicoccus fulvus TaxID=3138240 RepID=A0ABZ3FMX5_9ACTN
MSRNSADDLIRTPPKNWPPGAVGESPASVGRRGWRLLHDFATPMCSLSDSALTHNLAAIRDWISALGVGWAPHGKTTMSPELIARQLEAGAMGITAATPWQAERLVDWGVDRVVLANVCADPAPLARLLRRQVEVVTFVDSVESVRLTARAQAESGRDRLPVLIEVGMPGGRCGVRDGEAGLAVARAVADEPGLRLAGTATFEGTVTGRGADPVGAVRSLLRVVRELTEAMIGAELIDPGTDGAVLVSAGGSMYPDLVVDALRDGWSARVRLLLRSGCAVIHDHGLYAESAPARPDVRPALRVWSRVLSVPEPGWAIIYAGKRDLTVDPPARVLAVHRVTGTGTSGRTPVSLVLDHHNDQHGYVRFTDEDLRVGDLLELGISHPCLTFDRWTHIPVVDDELRVIGAVTTCF